MRIQDILHSTIKDQYKNNIDKVIEYKTETIYVKTTKTNKKILCDFCNELQISQSEFISLCIENIKRFNNQKQK
jgi:hypothetical protein